MRDESICVRTLPFYDDWHHTDSPKRCRASVDFTSNVKYVCTNLLCTHSVYFRKFCTQSNMKFWKIFQLDRFNDENKKYTAVCLENLPTFVFYLIIFNVFRLFGFRPPTSISIILEGAIHYISMTATGRGRGQKRPKKCGNT